MDYFIKFDNIVESKGVRTKLFQFHGNGNVKDKLDKNQQSESPFIHLNPISRNPGPAPGEFKCPIIL